MKDSFDSVCNFDVAFRRLEWLRTHVDETDISWVGPGIRNSLLVGNSYRVRKLYGLDTSGKPL